jgi:5'-3' exonuclease
MGIFNLGKLIESLCDINVISLANNTRGSCIVAVDSSIFMYRFLHNSKNYSEYVLNIIKFVTKLKGLCMEPIFVLDGKSRKEKLPTHRKRRQQKKNISRRIDNIKQKLFTMKNKIENLNDNNCTILTINLESELEKLIKKSNSINHRHIQLLKETLTMLGVVYIQSIGEADPFCAALVKENVAHCCLTNDNDLLAFGCPVTYQNFIFQNNQVTKYDLYEILQDLQITYDQFVDMIILMGTDYSKAMYGIKPQIAIECIKCYGSIENVLKNLDEINATIVKRFRSIYKKQKNLKKPDNENFDYEVVRKIFKEPLNIRENIQHTNYQELTYEWLYGDTRLRQLEQFLIDTVGLNFNEAREKVRYLNLIWTSVIGKCNASWKQEYKTISCNPINTYINNNCYKYPTRS